MILFVLHTSTSLRLQDISIMFAWPLFSISCLIARPSLALSPCAQMSDIYLSSPDLQPKVTAKLAYQCLIDVDFNASAAEPWLSSLEPYIEWQTITAYLKTPPDGYLMPPIHIHGELRKIKARANSTFGYQKSLILAVIYTICFKEPMMASSVTSLIL